MTIYKYKLYYSYYYYNKSSLSLRSSLNLDSSS